jgi:hypothetical protein
MEGTLIIFVLRSLLSPFFVLSTQLLTNTPPRYGQRRFSQSHCPFICTLAQAFSILESTPNYLTQAAISSVFICKSKRSAQCLPNPILPFPPLSLHLLLSTPCPSPNPRTSYLSPTNHMQVQMVHRLTPVGPIVDDYAEASWH